MDVAKYIGLFLLKNNSCYIHGLGNLEFRRVAASYDGSNLLPPSYEIVVAATNSIDDSLSNFIATNEQISISKATAALKEFSNNAKATLSSGKTVSIPSLGSFSEVNGKLLFNTVPYMQYTGTPVAAEKVMPKRPTPTPQPTVRPPDEAVTAIDNPYEYAAAKQGKNLNWGRIILFVLILLAMIAGIGFAVKTMVKPGGPMYNETNSKKSMPPADTLASQMPVDTTATIGADGLVNFKVILNTYETRRKAERRYQQLTTNGNIVELKAEDSSTYFILMSIHAPAADTAHIIDSLRITFNPDGVYLY